MENSQDSQITLLGGHQCNICKLVKHKLVQDGRIRNITLQHVDGPLLPWDFNLHMRVFYISHTGKQLLIRNTSTGHVYSGGLSHWTIPLKNTVTSFFNASPITQICSCGSSGVTQCSECMNVFCSKCIRNSVDKCIKKHTGAVIWNCPGCGMESGMLRSRFEAFGLSEPRGNFYLYILILWNTIYYSLFYFIFRSANL